VPTLRLEGTRVLSQFGSTACKAQYRCDECLEPFDYFKPH
jgi:ring-1,2-phenylacetyl-CoA epoxidase subunit PaaD